MLTRKRTQFDIDAAVRAGKEVAELLGLPVDRAHTLMRQWDEWRADRARRGWWEPKTDPFMETTE